MTEETAVLREMLRNLQQERDALAEEKRDLQKERDALAQGIEKAELINTGYRDALSKGLHEIVRDLDALSAENRALQKERDGLFLEMDALRNRFQVHLMVEEELIRDNLVENIGDVPELIEGLFKEMKAVEKGCIDLENAVKDIVTVDEHTLALRGVDGAVFTFFLADEPPVIRERVARLARLLGVTS